MTIHHSDIIYLWILIAVVVAVLEHEFSVYRESLKMFYVYVAINLIVWYCTIPQLIIDYKLRRGKRK